MKFRVRGKCIGSADVKSSSSSHDGSSIPDNATVERTDAYCFGLVMHRFLPRNPRLALSSIQSRARKTFHERTNERTKEQDSAPVRLCAEEGTRRGGSSPAQPLIHHADTRLTTSFQIYRVYQPCLISRNVFTTPYSKGCFPPSTITHAAPVSLWIVLECKNLEGYKLLSIITSMDKPVSRDATSSRMSHLRPRNFSFVTHLSISWRRSF